MFMMFFKDLKIRGKLFLAFGLICLILAIEGLMVLVNLNRIGNLSKHLYQKDIKAIRESQAILNHLNGSRLLVFRHLGEEDSETMKQIKKELDEEIKLMEKLLAENSTNLSGGKTSSRLQKVNAIWNSLAEMYEHIVQLSSDYLKEDGYDIANNNARQEFDKATEVFNQFLAEIHQSLDENYGASEDVKKKTIYSMLVVICGGIIISILLGVVISNRISKPILELVNQAKDIAQGRLDRQSARISSKDELGLLGGSFNKMQEELKGVIILIAQSANRLTGSANEISTMIQDQAGVVSQQSASVVEISATVDELSVSSTSVAEHAAAVAQISSKSLHECTSGIETIKSLRSKIEGIAGDNQMIVEKIIALGKKSDEIDIVVDIIKNIADQTKLIAFNAALEASSAGKAGQRFGYVASEIRRLAEDVTKSTIKIQKITSDIQEAMSRLVSNAEEEAGKFRDGMTLASKTSDELENLVVGVKDSADAATQISLSTRQQQTSTKQVLNALNEIAAGSRESSAAMEQISSVILNLSQLSATLNGMVNSFTINRDLEDSTQS